MWSDFLHVLGVDNVSGRWYAFWSGFAGAVPTFALLAGSIGFLRKHNCPVRNCHRIGRFPLSDGSGYFVCSRHHPTGAPRAEDIRERQL